MTKLEGNILLASVHGQACITTYYLPLVILKEEKLPNSLTYPCLYVTFFPEMCWVPITKTKSTWKDMSVFSRTSLFLTGRVLGGPKSSSAACFYLGCFATTVTTWVDWRALLIERSHNLAWLVVSQIQVLQLLACSKPTLVDVRLWYYIFWVFHIQSVLSTCLNLNYLDKIWLNSNTKQTIYIPLSPSPPTY